MTRYWIYFAGVITFGLIYQFLKSNLDQYIFVIASIIYLLGLNVLANKFGNDKNIDK